MQEYLTVSKIDLTGSASEILSQASSFDKTVWSGQKYASLSLASKPPKFVVSTQPLDSTVGGVCAKSGESRCWLEKNK